MTGLPDGDASRAVLIGVHEYEALDDLPAVAENLTGLRDVFTDPALWGLSKGNCVLVPQPPSARTVLDALWEAAGQATDALIVYYAGHGLTDPHTDELCLALPDSDPERPYTALPYESLRRVILEAGRRARRKVVMLDCCFSGRALIGGMSASTRVADQAAVEGTYLLTASAETRKALAPPGERYTAFTGELISTLSEGVPSGPALLDMETVYRHLHTRLSARSRPLPQQRNRNAGARIALVRNAAAKDRPEPPPASASTSAARAAARDPMADVHRGVTLLASKIARTLGPFPGLVRYTGPDGALATTADPAVICEVTTASGAEAELGAELVRGLVRRMRAEWSDGAATAVVMADAMIGRAFGRTGAGEASPARVGAALRGLGDRAAEFLRRHAVELGTKERLAQVVTTMTGDPDGATNLADAADAVGWDGVILVRSDDAVSGVDMLHDPQEYFLPGERSGGGNLPACTFLAPLLLVQTEPSPGDIPDRDMGSTVVVLRPVMGGIAMEVRGTERVESFLPDARQIHTLADIVALTGADLLPGGQHLHSVRVPQITIDGDGVHIIHSLPFEDDRLSQHVNRLRMEIAMATVPSYRADLEKRLARVVTGVATVRVGPMPGEPEPGLRERVNALARARNLMPALVKHGGVDGGGAALHAAAYAFAGEAETGPAVDVLYEGLRAPMNRFMADCGLRPERALSVIRSVRGANGFDLRTGRPAAMADAGIVDSAAVLAGAVTAAVETTQQFLALA